MIDRGLTDREFRRFQALIYDVAGISLTDAKRGMLQARLTRRVRATSAGSFKSYLDVVTNDADELTRMLDCVTTNETRFFRERNQFDYLENILMPRWRDEADQAGRVRTMRVWSAGCATGEEPYSLAMTLLDGLPGWDISITATDISTRALEHAVEARWSADKAAHIPDHLLKRFMLRGRGTQQGKMKAGHDIRQVVKFYRMNLNDAEYPISGDFDLILCRNVLIYFDTESRRRAIDRLLDRLAAPGFFFVGHAETLHGVTARVRPVAPTIYALVN